MHLTYIECLYCVFVTFVADSPSFFWMFWDPVLIVCFFAKLWRVVDGPIWLCLLLFGCFLLLFSSLLCQNAFTMPPFRLILDIFDIFHMSIRYGHSIVTHTVHLEGSNGSRWQQVGPPGATDGCIDSPITFLGIIDTLDSCVRIIRRYDRILHLCSYFLANFSARLHFSCALHKRFPPPVFRGWF